MREVTAAAAMAARAAAATAAVVTKPDVIACHCAASP